jgi:replicative DNA helicase
MSTAAPAKPRAPAGNEPPHNADVERAVLAVVLDGRHPDAWGRVRERCDGARAFFVRDHRLVALVIERLHAEGKAIDAQSVADAAQRIDFKEAIDRLRELDGEKRGALRLDQDTEYPDSLLAGIGGFNGIADLADAFAPVGGLERNAELVDEYHRRRRALDAIATTTDRLRRGAEPPERVADELAGRLGEVFGRGRVTQTLVDGVDQVIAQHDAAAQAGGGVTTGSWGLAALDNRLPLKAGHMTVLAGDTGGGKTSLALEAVLATARKLGRGSVAVINLEQDCAELAGILTARQLRVPKSTLEGGWLTAEQRQALDAVRADVERLGVHVRDNSGSSTIADLAGWIRGRKRRSDNLHLVVVDHIGLIDATSSREREYDTLTAASKQLKRLTTLGLHVLVVAQLNTEGAKRIANQEPKLTDLHGSGSMRKDADNVLFLWRRSADKSPTREVDLVGAKCRGYGEFLLNATFHAGDGQRFTMRTVRPEPDDPDHRVEAAKRAAKIDAAPADSEDLFAARTP